MANISEKNLYEFVLAQFGAESYLDSTFVGENDLLRLGNNNPNQTAFQADPGADNLPGKTRMTNSQITRFGQTYDIAQRLPNTWSGFSATLFRNKLTSEYVLSFRSTEYPNASQGGDWERDGANNGAADGEIGTYGFALAQIADMEAFYRQLRAPGAELDGKNFTVTGYSLGGHLATVFAEAHENDAGFLGAVTFNSPGRGAISGGTVTQLVDRAYAVLSRDGYTLRTTPAGFNIYEQGFYTGNDATPSSRAEILAGYSTAGLSIVGAGTPTLLAGGKITQVYGLADINDSTWVANSGIYSAITQKVFIEDQPASQGAGPFSFLGRILGLKENDFGTTHSITLIADSAAAGELLQTIYPLADQSMLDGVFATGSNERGFTTGALFGLGGAGRAESDSLEQIVQSIAKLYGADLSAQNITREGQILRGDRGGDFGNLANRNAFYEALGLVTAKVQADGGGTLASFNGQPASNLALVAKQDTSAGLSYRYALVEGNSFAVVKDRAFYDAKNHTEGSQGKRLDLYSLGGGGLLTDFFLDDRAGFIERRTYFNVNNARYDLLSSSSNPGNRGDAVATAYNGQNVVWDDRATGALVRRAAEGIETVYRKFGTARTDALVGGAGADRIYGGDGIDIAQGGLGGDYIEGGRGLDMYGFASGDGADTLLDVDGKGLLTRNGSSLAVGVKQDATTWTLGGTTYRKNGADLDIFFADTATDKITVKDFDFTKAGQDGYLGIRLLDAPSGPTGEVRAFLGDYEDFDSDTSNAQPDPVSDGFGNNLRADGQGGRPLIEQADRADTFTGSSANEVEKFLTGGGNDAIYADGNGSITSSTGGRDNVDAGSGNDFVAAGAGNDWVVGGSGEDVLLGNADDDALYAVGEIGIGQAIANGNSDANVGTKGDFLAGGEGKDVLIGSAAGDVLSGGAGIDLIVAGAGDDNINGDGSILSATIDWTAARSVTGSGDTATFSLAYGEVVFTSTPGAGAADAIYAGKGDDWVFAGEGDDFVEGGDGKDVIFGEAGADVLIGGEGDDFLIGDSASVDAAGQSGADYLEGGAGNDTLLGGGGDDVLYGGAGTDILAGGTGKDTYVYYRGDGEDIVKDPDITQGSQYRSSLILGPGITRDEVKFRLGSLMIDVGQGDAIHFSDFNPQDPNATPVLDSIQFSDGTQMSYQDVLDQGFDLDGTEGDDVISGTGVTDRISGFGGSDTLIGKAGNDTILGGEGNDDIDAGAGDDVVDGGAGHDIIDGGDGNDSLTTSGGDDFVYGGAGNDAFFVTDGDTVIDTEGTNTLDLTAWTALDSGNLEITQFETADGEQYLNLHVRDNLNPGVTPATGGVSVERGEAAQFAAVMVNDGAGGTALLGYDALMAQYAAQGFVYKGSDGAQTLTGTAFADTMQGYGGDDTLNAGAGADRLDGGAGNDTLSGGAGNDTYLLARNGGRDTVVENGNAEPNSTNTIQLDAGITSGMVGATQLGNDLEVRLRATADALVLKDFYSQPQSWREGWQVLDAANNSYALASFVPRPPPPPANGWLDEQKNAFRARRVQVYAANRQAEGYAAIGGNAFQSVTQQHYYDTRQTITTTGTRQLVIQNASSDAASITAGTQFTTVIHSASNANFVIGQPRVRGLAEGRNSVSSGFGAAGAPAGGDGEFIPSPFADNPGVQGRLSGTGLRIGPGDLVVPVFGPRVGAAKSVIRNAGSADFANAGNFGDPANWVLQGYRVYRAGSPAIGNESAVRGQVAATVTNTTVEQKLTVSDLSAGASANTILVGDASVVEAGGGNDTIVMSSGFFFAGPDWERPLNPTLEFGSPSTTSFGPRENGLGGFVDAGAGDDRVTGSDAQDTIAGGDGNDTLDGRAGSDRYLFAADESGIDTIADSGLDAHSYLDQYYWRQGILNWEERATHPGEWRGSSGVRAEYFPTQEEAIFFVEHNDVEPGVTFIAPLSAAAPLLTRNDTAALARLTTGGVLDLDVVEFGPGLTLDDLSITLHANGAADPLAAGGTLSVRWNGGAAGFDTTVSDAAYGFVGSDLLTDGVFDPDQQAPGSWRGYRLGEGIEELRFADGTRFSVEQLLALPQLSFGDYAFAPSASEQVIDRRYARVVFDPALGSFGLRIGREGQDLVFGTINDGARGRIAGWYSDPANLPRTVFTFAGDPEIDAATLTGRGLTVHGTAGDDVLAGLDGFDDTIFGAAGNDAITGGSGFDTLFGEDGDDTIDGGAGDDFIEGGDGIDLLRGSAGNDEIDDTSGNLIEGGAGDDSISQEGGNFIAGGAGDDYIGNYGDGAVIAFNPGDGNDTVYAAGNLTLSIGGGVTTADLALTRDGEDLLLSVGASDSIRLTRQFEADPQAWPAITLQLFASVHTYDLTASIDGNIADFHLADSNTDARGGALAWQYATAGSIGALSDAQIRQVLAGPGFGTAPQPIVLAPNHAPEIGAAVLAATVTEDNSLPAAAPLGAGGSLLFSDVDVGDTHEVQVGTLDSGYLGEFTAQIVADSTGGGAGSVQWTFSVDNGALDGLGAGETRLQSYEVLVDDGHGGLAQRVVTVTLAGVNDAPVAIDDAAAVQEDGALVAAGNLLGNDSDVDLNSVLQVSNPGTFTGSFGTLMLAADGSYSYALDNAAAQSLAAGQQVSDVFGYAATDGLISSSASLFMEISGMNDAPVAADDAASAQEDGALIATGNLLTNDSDIDANSLLQVSNSGTFIGNYGTLTLAADGSYSYALDNAAVQSLAAGQHVTDVFAYAADDGLASSSASIFIEISGMNDAPVTAADTASVQEDGPLTATGNVLANDSDVDANTVLQVANPGVFAGSYGTLTLAAGGSYSYALDNAAAQSLAAGQSVQDTFSYVATDGIAGSTATLTVTITGANDAPATANDTANVQEDVTLTAAGNVLANDSDVDSNSFLQIANPGTTAGNFGSLTLAANGAYTYTLANGAAAVQSLAAGQTVTDTFGYAASDGGASTPATLTVNVAGSNDAPVTANDAANVREDVTLTATGNVLANDSDIDSNSFLQVLNPGAVAGNYGTLSLAANGSYTYTLANGSAAVQGLGAGQSVTDSFGYAASDGIASTPAMLTVTVAGTNDAPVTQADAASVQEDAALTASGNVLANDSDVDSGSLLNVAAPGTFSGSYGSLTLSANGSYTYTLANASAAVQSLAAGQTVTDVFGYAASDGIVSTPSTLTVSIAGTNDAPVTASDAASVKEDVTLTATGNVLVNDLDVDSNSVLQVLNPGTVVGSYGSLSLGANGAYTYTLANASASVQALRAGQSVSDTFAYAATDGIASTTGSLMVTVNGTNDNPIAQNDSGAAQEDGPAVTLLAGTLLANDTDADAGDTKAITAVANSTAGALVTLVGGNAVYNVGGLFQTLKAGATATDSFSYTMVDGAGAASSATVLMTVTGVNDAPVLAVPIADQNAQAGTAFSFSFAAGTFIDIDAGDTLAYAASLADGSGLPSWLAFNAATRTFSGTPPGSTTPQTLNIRVGATDTANASASDQFSLNIAGSAGGGDCTPIVGTDHDDVIAGTSGNDVIDGRKGYDRMAGGAGDDVYYVDQTGSRVDLVTEAAVAGYDTVYSQADYTLPSNVEELHLIGDEDLEGHGNALANMLIGNAGDNRLFGEAGNDLLLDDAGDDRLDGGAGDDVLDGGVGNDTLIGGAGNDLFVHTAGGGDDVVQDSGGTDAIRFGTGITTGNVTVRRSDNDLMLRLSGGNGSVRVKDWFASAAKRVEQVQFADGTTWNEAAIRTHVTTGSSSGGSSGGGYGGDNGHSNDSSNGNHGSGHDDDHDGHGSHHGDHDDDDERGGLFDAIAQRLKHNPDYDYTALAQYLQRNGGGGYGAMTPQQIASRWLQVQNCVASLAQMDDGDGHGGHGGDHHDGGSGGDDDRARGGWGHAGSTGQNRGYGGMDGFAGLGEGFRRL